MSDPIIRIENVSKRYIIGHETGRKEGLRHAIESAVRSPARWFGSMRERRRAAREEFWALRGVNLEVSPGEVVGVIGRNGAGKSTLLKVLSRITEPTEGRIRLRGRIASLLEVGTGFHPELTGRENIFLNGAVLGMTRAEIKRNFDEIVAFAGVDRFLDTPVKRYSSGMYVRLAFAVAAHLEPEILVVDEVLAVGDAEFQKKCITKMEDVSTREGRTVLVVSHQMSVIQNLCTRCVLLDQGRVVMQGKADAVISEYLATGVRLSNLSLSERTDRVGAGRARMNHIEVLDANGRAVEEAVSGMDLVIRVHYQVRPGVVLENCRFSVAMMKDLRIVFLLSSDLVDTRKVSLDGNGIAEFVVPRLPLSEGRYHLTPYLGSDGGTEDWIDDAAVLSVADGDFYGTGGRVCPPGFQGKYVLIDHGWRLLPEENGVGCPAEYSQTTE